ncbi:MAG: DUF839 domain-containing protein [Polyangiaceae bacterium]|jgi:hypothetical protein|nr:DUF839 domain-containing protein [Polyangiaceae bacterium]
MSGRIPSLWHYTLGGAVAIALGLAACGDDDDTTGSPRAGSGGAGTGGAAGGSAGQGGAGRSGAGQGGAGQGGAGQGGASQGGAGQGGAGQGGAGAGGSGGASAILTGLPARVRSLTDAYRANALPAGVEFPVAAATDDQVRSLAGAVQSVVASWLDPLTADENFAGGAPFFGSNNDFIAYFGEGWDATPGDAPQWHGSSDAAWLWVNHEYVSNNAPALASAPTGQHLTLATFLRDKGVLTTEPASEVWTQPELNAYVGAWKRQVGGSWVRITRSPAGAWSVDRSADNRRYDATSGTRSLLTGHSLTAGDVDDAGAPLPAGVVAGILANCSGGQTPWGTVVTAEENFQFAYGDAELGWSDGAVFDPSKGLGPGTPLGLTFTPQGAGTDFGRASVGLHSPESYGYLAEIDPGVASDQYYGAGGTDRGHKKLGYFGRARWENAAFAVDEAWKPLAGKRLVVYSGDDRRNGRIYKFVSSGVYAAGMTRAQARALLDDGDLYVAQFDGLDNATGKFLAATGGLPTEAQPGQGRWIHLSVNNVTDTAPNAAPLGVPGKKVGEALQDLSWNDIGGFANDDVVRRALFTASNKLGIVELNRPEDIEWNPRDPSGTPRLYVAFTNHNRITQLTAQGVLRKAAECAGDNLKNCSRNDTVGAIFSIEEANPADPGASTTFTYRSPWQGSVGAGPFDAANPDNLFIDQGGGVWFGTDGNYGVSGKKSADGVYYLDLDPSHTTGPRATYGKAFRVAAMPSDAEATGPALSSDGRTLFISVQHPGEDTPSAWPAGGSAPPRSSVVALYFADP